MNGIKASIKILVQTLYIEDDSSFILLDDLLERETGVFHYFLGATSSERYLKKTIVESMKEVFGNNAVEDGTKGKRIGFYVESKYCLERCNFSDTIFGFLTKSQKPPKVEDCKMELGLVPGWDWASPKIRWAKRCNFSDQIFV